MLENGNGKKSSLAEREARRNRTSFVRNVVNVESEAAENSIVDAPIKKSLSGDEIVSVPIDMLQNYHNHPFKVKDDEEMEKLTESIKEYGVLYPLLCRPIGNGGLEIIAGHRRRRGASRAGLKEVPVIIKDLDDNQADIIMVDSNIQRENISFSEKAFAYKIKMDAIKRQGQKSEDGNKIDSAEEIGGIAGDSKRTVFRYIRLTNLVHELLELVDNKKIPAFTTGLTLSYLTVNEQNVILEFYKIHDIIPTPAQATVLKDKHNEFAAEGRELESKDVLDILGNKKVAPKKVVFKEDKIKKYFPKDTSVEDMENKILELLEAWKEKENE